MNCAVQKLSQCIKQHVAWKDQGKTGNSSLLSDLVKTDHQFDTSEVFSFFYCGRNPFEDRRKTFIVVIVIGCHMHCYLWHRHGSGTIKNSARRDVS